MRRAGGFIVNKTYKVIYNRTRCMYQVVSELAKGHTKSETPEMLKSLFNKHSGLTRGIVMAVLSMSLAMPVGVAGQADDTSGSSASETTTNTSSTTATDTAANVDSTTIGTLDANGNYIQKDASVSSNLSKLDTQVKTNADAIDSTVKYTDSNKTKVMLAGEGGTTVTNVKDGALNDSSTDAVTGKPLYNVSNRIGTLDTDGTYIKMEGSVSSNLSKLDTQVKTNADDISSLTSDTTSKLAAKANVDASNIGKNIDTTSTTTDDEKKKMQEDNATLWGEALGLGAIENDDSMLISGGTLYNELRPSDGTYVKSANTTADNLLALDTNLKNVIDAIGLDADDTTTSYTSKLNKYFKVNPEVTTAADGKTKNYAADAAANGTNSVVIGPSAQAGESTTDATTSTTTVTGGTSSTAVGDSAKANGNQAVALGYSASVLNPSSGTSTGSTAIGSNATVDSASNAMALGTKATINETATNGLAIGNGAVTGSAKTTATKADNTIVEVAAAGGVNSVAIGTGATNAGNTSIALGGGASVTNDTDGNYQAVVKSDDIAIGTSAKTSASDYSTAIGKSASVSQSTDAVHRQFCNGFFFQ